jgi:hypothetical protein
VDEKLSAPQPVEAPAVVVEPPLPMKKEPITVVLFDFSRLRTEPDKFAHLRVIGGTGIGKTTFVDWLLDILGGSRFVITPKKKSWHWVGLKFTDCGLTTKLFEPSCNGFMRRCIAVTL